MNSILGQRGSWSTSPSLFFVIVCLTQLLVSSAGAADPVILKAVGIRGGFSGHSFFGEENPQGYQQYDVVVTVGLPWSWYADNGWGVSTRMLASAGALRGVGETNFIGTLVPALAVGRRDERIMLIVGGGGALLSDYKFGNQNFGGAFQFVATVGLSSRIVGPVTLGYFIQHYSDATLYGQGEGSRGADMHLFELSYSY